jgi:hypothetical protein
MGLECENTDRQTDSPAPDQIEWTDDVSSFSLPVEEHKKNKDTSIKPKRFNTTTKETDNRESEHKK